MTSIYLSSSSSSACLGEGSQSEHIPRLDRNYYELDGLSLTQHGNIVDTTSVEENRFVLFTPEEMVEKKIMVYRGQLCIGKNSDVLTTINEEGIMVVMFDDGEIYGAYPIAGSIFHSSLTLPDKKIIAAANLKAFQGEIYYADDISGHLAPPSERLDYLLSELLHHRGCNYSQHRLTIKRSKFPPLSNEHRIPPDLRAKLLKEILRKKGSPIQPSPPNSNPSTPRSTSDKARRLSHEFQSLSTSPNQSPSLKNRRIMSIVADSSKNE